MQSQIKAVLLTYVARRSMQVILGGGGLVYALAIFVMAMDSRTASEDRVDVAVPLLLFPAGFISYLLASQAKWQFVDHRARTLPRFAAPHLAVILVIAIVGFLALPTLAAIAMRLSPIGYLACTIAFAAPFIWSSHANGGPAGIAAMAVFFGLYSADIRSFWFMPTSVSRYFPLHFFVLVAGWAGIATWLFRLSRLNEESDAYNIPIQAQSGSATRMERSQANRNIMRHKLANGLWKGGPSDWWHDRLKNHLARSVRDRQHLFRYGFAAIPVELNGLWMAAGMLTTIAIIYGMAPASGPGRAFGVGALAPMVFLPAMFPGQFLAMRRARLTQELLLPFTRTQFINGIFVELARNTVITLIVMLAVAGAALVVLPTDNLETSKLIAALTLLAAVQPYFFGAATYAALRQSAMARIGIMMAAMMPAVMACVGGVASLQWTGPLPALLIAAAVFPVGVVVVRKSRQAWLDTELA